MDKVYLCDPSRNKNCTKEYCYTGEDNWRPCSNTSDPNAAFINSKGEVVVDSFYFDSLNDDIKEVISNG